MQTVGIVVLSLIGGLLIALLLIGLAFLLWVSLYLKRAVVGAEEKEKHNREELVKCLDHYTSELKTAVANHVAVMSVQREKSEGSFNLLLEQTRLVLSTHEKHMAEEIKRINVEQFEIVAGRCLQACVRMEKIVGILQQAFLNAEDRSTHEYGPDDYAPEDSPKFGTPPSGFSVSQTTSLDQQAEQEERAT